MAHTTHTTAPEAASLATFKGWLKSRQQAAIDGTNTTTGEEFILHLAALNMTIEATRALSLFERIRIEHVVFDQEGGAA